MNLHLHWLAGRRIHQLFMAPRQQVVESDTLDLDDVITFAYTIVRPSIHHAAIFGVQADGAIRCYYPGYGVETSVRLQGDKIDEPLGDGIRLRVHHKPGWLCWASSIRRPNPATPRRWQPQFPHEGEACGGRASGVREGGGGRKRSGSDKQGDFRAAVQDFLRSEDLAAYPNTGVIFAASSESETKWRREPNSVGEAASAFWGSLVRSIG